MRGYSRGVGYTASRRLDELFPTEPLERSLARTARDTGRLIERQARRNTPVSTPPQGMARGEWLASRGGRRPGRMRSRWRTSEPTRTASSSGRGAQWSVTIENTDPQAVHVEYPTRPHVIRPRRDRAPASVLATGRPRKAGTDPDARLRFIYRGRVTYAREVHHPGTQGVFMLRRALEHGESVWVREVGEREVRRWAREMTERWR